MSNLLPTYFISHGGGPWSFMDDERRPRYAALEASLAALGQAIAPKPAAVLCVSAHWEAHAFAVMGAARPPMYYDYSGFPDYTYQIQYPAPGSPELAERVRGLLMDAGLAATVDSTRGFDHGTFTPLKVIYPEADVPVVQLSLLAGLDPAAHLAAGRALAPLRAENVLILGSGLSFHNLSCFGRPESREPSSAFDAWLGETLLEREAEERSSRLVAWETAPQARLVHPREEHLIPLLVALGAAEQEPATRVYYEQDFMQNLTVSSYQFG